MTKNTIFLSLALALSLTIVSGFAKQNLEDQSFLLRWKVPKGKTIAYKTAMDPVNPKKEKLFRLDIDQLAGDKKLSPSIKKKLSQAKFPKSYSVTSTVKGLANGNLAVKMILNKVPDYSGLNQNADKDLIKMMKDMAGTVQLRGQISDSGKIKSFWLEQRQKNLLANFFELPTKPVKAGDEWSIKANLISMGPGFTPRKATKTNRVKLVSLTKTADGDTIAKIDYHIAESVEGAFKLPTLAKSDPASTAIGMVGQGEFLVNKGRWKKFTGRMHVKSTGLKEADFEQHFSMEPLENVPKKLLNIE